MIGYCFACDRRDYFRSFGRHSLFFQLLSYMVVIFSSLIIISLCIVLVPIVVTALFALFPGSLLPWLSLILLLFSIYIGFDFNVFETFAVNTYFLFFCSMVITLTAFPFIKYAIEIFDLIEYVEISLFVLLLLISLSLYFLHRYFLYFIFLAFLVLWKPFFLCEPFLSLPCFLCFTFLDCYLILILLALSVYSPACDICDDLDDVYFE